LLGLDWSNEVAKKFSSNKVFSFWVFWSKYGGSCGFDWDAKLPSKIVAVVSRGGRPDLAGYYLHRVAAPTLLLVGSLDTGVFKLNRIAVDQMANEKKLIIIPGATHLFEKQGALEEVAEVSTDWFLK
jgi:putative phosphoribosyl transferase